MNSVRSIKLIALAFMAVSAMPLAISIWRQMMSGQ